MIPFLIAVLITAISSSPNQNGGEEIYRKYCAGCHGHQLQGSTASALLKPNLNHGSDRESILKIVRAGIPATQMIGYNNTLNSQDIEAVTDFIMAARKNPGILKADQQLMQAQTKHYKLNIEKIIGEGLNGPWGMEFVDGRRALITGKMGELYWMVNNSLDTQRIQGLPKVYGYDLVGGMMDLAIDPDYKNNGWIYLAFSHNPKNLADKTTPGMTKIVRGKIEGHQWVEEQTLFQVHDSLLVTSGMRWGSRFMFDKDGYLYFTIGDMQASKQSGRDPQILSRPQGKIFRIHPDGSIPKDNPLFGRPHMLQAIFAWGTRNVQGMAQDPVSGKIYFSDHGPQGGDELNILKNGADYGWPAVTYGINYDGSIITKDTVMEGMESPITYWTPSIAVCAVEFVENPLFPEWKNNLLLTTLKYEELRRLVIKNNKVMEQEILLKGYGRVRDVKAGPDGALYMLTNAPDAVWRITPARN